jgi:hypothetical protein
VMFSVTVKTMIHNGLSWVAYQRVAPRGLEPEEDILRLKLC